MANVFDPEVIHECAMQCLGKQKPEMFDAFADAMDQHYPGVLDRGQPWIYSIAGGAMIQMKLYYASLSEYIMIWGTPIGSEGHSGRHRVGFWDTVIDGETWYYAEGEFEKRIYQARRPHLRRPRPGVRHELHRRRVGRGVRARPHPDQHPLRSCRRAPLDHRSRRPLRRPCLSTPIWYRRPSARSWASRCSARSAPLRPSPGS